MGKWTLAHTESLCSEKFHTALQKPLSQSGMKLEEFFEAFDPQDPLVQRLLGALVNDAARRKSPVNKTSGFSGRIAERSHEAVQFISHSEPFTISSRPTRTTIRARRRHELTGGPDAPGVPWQLSYPPPPDVSQAEMTSSSSLNLYEAFSHGPDGAAEDETSGEYWWRQTHSTDVPESTFIMNRPSPSPPIPIIRHSIPRRERLPPASNRYWPSLTRFVGTNESYARSPGNSGDGIPPAGQVGAPTGPAASLAAARSVGVDNGTGPEVFIESPPPHIVDHTEHHRNPVGYTESTRSNSFAAGRLHRSPSPMPFPASPLPYTGGTYVSNLEDSVWR